MNTKVHGFIVSEREVADRAQQLWRIAGRPPERDLEFWFAAEARVIREREEIDRTLNEEIRLAA